MKDQHLWRFLLESPHHLMTLTSRFAIFYYHCIVFQHWFLNSIYPIYYHCILTLTHSCIAFIIIILWQPDVSQRILSFESSTALTVSLDRSTLFKNMCSCCTATLHERWGVAGIILVHQPSLLDGAGAVVIHESFPSRCCWCHPHSQVLPFQVLLVTSFFMSPSLSVVASVILPGESFLSGVATDILPDESFPFRCC